MLGELCVFQLYNTVFCPCAAAAVGIWSKSLCRPGKYKVFVLHALGGDFWQASFFRQDGGNGNVLSSWSSKVLAIHVFHDQIVI